MSTINMSELDYLCGQRHVLADRIADAATRLLIEYIDRAYPDAAYIVCDDAELYPVAVFGNLGLPIAGWEDHVMDDEELHTLVGNMHRSLIGYRKLPSPDAHPRGETRIIITEVKEFLA